MPNELVELIEAKLVDYITGQDELRFYEVYKGDWVKLYTTSGNAYWHTTEVWQESFPEYSPIARRSYLVLSDSGYIGHWDSQEAIYEFLRLYMRAEITETMLV
jgi:hypothetical protein